MTKANFRAFVCSRAEIASRHGLTWNVRIVWDGKVHQEDIWDLSSALELPRTTKSRITDLGADRKALKYLPGNASELELTLHRDWVELIKASIIDWVFIEKRLPGTVQDRRVRPLRVIATCAGNTPPVGYVPRTGTSCT